VAGSRSGKVEAVCGGTLSAPLEGKIAASQTPISEPVHQGADCFASFSFNHPYCHPALPGASRAVLRRLSAESSRLEVKVGQQKRKVLLPQLFVSESHVSLEPNERRGILFPLTHSVGRTSSLRIGAC
jgi:hypothetical protein